MIATPELVLPIIECSIAPLRSALSDGIEFADALQPDRTDRWFWAHSARFHARRRLIAAEKDGWTIAPTTPNSGIHLGVGLHTLRVLRSLGGLTPHPGRNGKRWQYWVQEGLFLAQGGTLPSLSLIVDWQVINGKPLIHVGLPERPWTYGTDPRMHWRVPATGDADGDLEELEFNPDGGSADEVSVILQIDETEEDSG